MPKLIQRSITLLLFLAILPHVSNVAAQTNQKPVNLAARFARLRRGINLSHWFSQAANYSKTHLDTHTTAQDIALIIQHESGGNPNAQNNWDSNAKKGTPSIGLMQTIQPTFDSYKLPGHNNIRNPVDNIIAGVRYSIARYGSVSNVPGLRSMANGGGYVGY